jgi:proteasome alpha subunit
MEIGNFISPKQLLEIKADLAEAALAQANPIVAVSYEHGALLVAENPSRTLNKISEVYDRIAFAGTGVYNDYERLRRQGIQSADLRGFGYSRQDVRAKTIAGDFATILGDVFTSRSVPLEVEILLIEIGSTPEDPIIFYKVLFSGGLLEDLKFSVIGDIHIPDKASTKRKKNLIYKYLQDRDFAPNQPLSAAFDLCCKALESARDSRLQPQNIEAAVLDRSLGSHRKFRRLGIAEIRELSEQRSGGATPATPAKPDGPTGP